MSERRVLPRSAEAALGELRDRLAARYGERLRGMYLYGSYARGDFTDDSDIDVLIVLADDVNPWAELNSTGEVVSDICLRHDLLIAEVPVTEAWLNERKNAFFENLRREAVRL